MYLSDLVDTEIQEVLEEAKLRCRNILSEKREIIENLSAELLEK